MWTRLGVFYKFGDFMKKFAIVSLISMFFLSGCMLNLEERKDNTEYGSLSCGDISRSIDVEAIKSAKVTAVIPDTITIDITLSKPSYAVKTDRLTYIANEDSKVLEVTATADEVKVPLIEGVSVKDAKAGEHLEFESTIVKESLNEMFNLAKEKGYDKITRVDITSNQTHSGTQTMEIRYVYDDRIVVYLGIPENITYKMQTAQTIIDEKLDVNGAVLTGELDVSNSYDTKKSYFNQYSLIPEVVIPEPSGTSATEPATTVSEDYAADAEDEYYDEYYDDSEDDYVVEDAENADYIEENEEVYW